jgi:hypothetical protein
MAVQAITAPSLEALGLAPKAPDNGTPQGDSPALHG